MAYFDGIKVGDTVYFQSGSSMIVEWVEQHGNFNFKAINIFDLNGRLSGFEYLGQVAFWQPPPKIEPPPRPKQKQKVVIEDVMWENSGFCCAYPICNASQIKSGFKNGWQSFIGKPPMTMTLEWEE